MKRLQIVLLVYGEEHVVETKSTLTGMVGLDKMVKSFITENEIIVTNKGWKILGSHVSGYKIELE